MNGCVDKLHRGSRPRRECARDTIADVDPMQINVRIDNHSDVPLESWQDHLKRQRRQIGPRPERSKTPPPVDRPPPDTLIDEYAAPA
jgi:hypothetical protein